MNFIFVIVVTMLRRLRSTSDGSRKFGGALFSFCRQRCHYNVIAAAAAATRLHSNNNNKR